MKRPVFRFARCCVLLGLLCMLPGCDGPATQEDLSALKGQWLFINYWAAWCKPCIEEIPELNRFASENAPGVKVFGVNFDGITGTDLEQQAAELQIQFTNLQTDPAAQLGYSRPNVLPSTIIINPQGELHRILKGPQTVESLSGAIDEDGNL